MAISWTKLFSSADDGSKITGTQIGVMQNDITTGTAGSLPTPTSIDSLKVPRVKSDYSGYELVSQVPITQGGTGASLAAGTAGHVVMGQGTASAMILAPLYQVVTMTFTSTSAAQTVYCPTPVTGNVSYVYVANHLAARGAGYTLTVGSAGATIATGTVLSTGVAGAITTITVSTGSAAVVAGGSFGIARAAQGTDGISTVTIVITRGTVFP